MDTNKKVWLLEPAIFANTEFDYLIIGGGTAGLVVASRLAEDSRYKVGIIEAGLDHLEDPLINVPSNSVGSQSNDVSHEWAFVTTPQENVLDRSIPIRRGKLLGGSSAVNRMIYQRGSKADYDNWEKLGNPGWGWDGLLPYFKKAETYIPHKDKSVFPGADASQNPRWAQSQATYHGNQGPLKITHNDGLSPLLHEIIETMNNVGIHTNLDPESGDATGVFEALNSISRPEHTRTYAANTYLTLFGNQENLSVITNAQATKILFSERTNANDDLIATGVEFISDGATFVVHAKKEVIVSAGTIQTPQLLELSGIGDAKLLSKYGVPCLLDIPQVGENYQEHVGVDSLFSIKPEFLESVTSDITFPKQPGCGAAAFSFYSLNKIFSEADLALSVQELDKSFATSGATLFQQAQFDLQRKSIHTNIGTAESVVSLGLFGKSAQLFMLAGLSHPYSRGHVHIQSKNALSDPMIEGCFLKTPFDLVVLRNIVKFFQKLSKTDPLGSFVTGQISPPDTIQTDQEYDEFVRKSLRTLFHPVGTASMAPRELGGVVNPSLLVYGTRNLRVVDASIIPMHIAAHTQATVYAIAEKAADIIKGKK